MQLNKIKAFSLIELLVVIILIGVISVVAIPNVREFLVDKELRQAIAHIENIVGDLKSRIDSSASDTTTNFPIVQARVDFTTTNGLTISTIQADQNNFFGTNRRLTVCNASGQWLQPTAASYNYQTNGYDIFSSIRLGFIYGTDGTSCFSKYQEFISQNKEIKFALCHETKLFNSNSCTGVSQNAPFYRLTVSRDGKVGVEKYDVSSGQFKYFKN